MSLQRTEKDGELTRFKTLFPAREPLIKEPVDQGEAGCTGPIVATGSRPSQSVAPAALMSYLLDLKASIPGMRTPGLETSGVHVTWFTGDTLGISAIQPLLARANWR